MGLHLPQAKARQDYQLFYQVHVPCAGDLARKLLQLLPNMQHVGGARVELERNVLVVREPLRCPDDLVWGPGVEP